MDRKILIVDDEVHIRLLLEQTLEVFEDHGAELLVASNGESALTIVREQRPELVFLDVIMQDLDGFEVCKQIKSEPELKETYIILLTAKGQEFDRHLGYEVGADMYLTKPFDPDDLVRLTGEVLKVTL